MFIADEIRNERNTSESRTVIFDCVQARTVSEMRSATSSGLETRRRKNRVSKAMLRCSRVLPDASSPARHASNSFQSSFTPFIPSKIEEVRATALRKSPTRKNPQKALRLCYEHLPTG